MPNTSNDKQQFPDGFYFLSGRLDEAAQVALTMDVGRLLQQAPLFEQRMPRTGAPMSVRMSNADEYGWVTDREHGYHIRENTRSRARPGLPFPSDC